MDGSWDIHPPTLPPAGPVKPQAFVQTGTCHYCGGPAWTKDHIVPRSWLPRGYRLAVPNLVPACGPCNQRKGDRRGDCTCDVCTAAWAAFEAEQFVAPTPSPHDRGASWCAHCQAHHVLDVFTDRKPGCPWRWTPPRPRRKRKKQRAVPARSSLPPYPYYVEWDFATRTYVATEYYDQRTGERWKVQDEGLAPGVPER